ncbi:hypothetical protein K439DRAFT_741493 [Ramaria rubella]|nr:hypothetical protein K439DRAFT_741493 [Ramaria rubella]
MKPGSSTTSSDEDAWGPSGRRSKRIIVTSRRVFRTSSKPQDILNKTKTGLCIDTFARTPPLQNNDFEEILQKEDYIAARMRHLKENSELDPYNNRLRPLTISEIHRLREWLHNTAIAGRQHFTGGENILAKKLSLRKPYVFLRLTAKASPHFTKNT